MEEVGIQAEGFCLISVCDSIDERGHYIHTSFSVERFIGEIQCMEPEFCYGWQFFHLNNLPDEIFRPHIKIIKNYLNKTLY